MDWDRKCYSKQTYLELIQSFLDYLDRYPDERLVSLISDKPLNKQSIDLLIADGWVLKQVPDDAFHNGECRFDTKELRINQISGIERDTTLVHEILHALYGEDSVDSSPIALYDLLNYRGSSVEVFARTFILDKELVRHATKRFGLPPQDYPIDFTGGMLPSRLDLYPVHTLLESNSENKSVQYLLNLLKSQDYKCPKQLHFNF